MVKPKKSLTILLGSCMVSGAAQAQSSSGISVYGSVGGGRDLVQSARFATGAFRVFKANQWGLEASFRRSGFQARNLPADYTFGSGGFNFGAVRNEMLDDVNIYNLAVLRRWGLSKNPRLYVQLGAGLSLADYFGNQFTFTGVQSSGGWFPTQSANYSTTVDRQALPGLYGRAAVEFPVVRFFSVEAGVWTSLSPKLQYIGLELLFNIGKIYEKTTTAQSSAP